MKFCPACGQPVEMRIPPGDNLPRAVCTACGTIHYENPRMVVGCVPEWQGRIPPVPQRRNRAPSRLLDYTGPGFMENGETLQGTAAARESLEEAQARVQVGSLVSITSDAGMPDRCTSTFAGDCSTANMVWVPKACGLGYTPRPKFPGLRSPFPVLRFALRSYFRRPTSRNGISTFQRY